MKGNIPLKQLNTPRQIITPKAYLTTNPGRVSPETELWLGALGFLEAVLKFDKEAPSSFLDIIMQYGKPGCQQLINEAENEQFNAHNYAAKLIAAQQEHRAIPRLSSVSTIMQRYESQINSGTFNNKDLMDQITMISQFMKAHCNKSSHYLDGTCRITIEKSPLLYSTIMLKSLYEHYRITPELIDHRRFGESYDLVYKNPTGYQQKKAKHALIAFYEKLHWRLHNDSYYVNKAELFYRVTVNPGRLVTVVNELSQVDHRNQKTVRRQILNRISLVKVAVMPDIDASSLSE